MTHEETPHTPIAKYTAELIGTMILVIMGCGSAVIAGSTIGNLGVAFAFGLSVIAMAYAFGRISGCHINPAITISMFVAGKIDARDTAFYIAFQSIGATIGAGILYIIASGNPGYNIAYNGLGQNSFSTSNNGFGLVPALIAEIVLTFIFVLAVHGATHEKSPKGFAGIAIGLTLTLVHLVGIPLTGTSVNPARSLGPALITAIFDSTTALSQLWVFWVAPIIGGILAALVWKIFKK
ncbi:aquaporin Z [Candidatus Bathycorpusculum sp.]|jgi:aquaporin Z|uniref:aquaporin Z n=1 Tax=Candidatus Bathycorpusculum sp. TaxID=2994959 RepID=UPI0028362D0A|nr:aquaporin Z [Candidatus Termitimicrobium sp.]MCL2685376.1 aquaporin Z [Candidatus Termitimicrobium sp.]